MHNNLEDLKNKYHEGYRCIFKDNQEGCTLHLKNFEREKIYTIQSMDKMEIGAIENFLDQIDQMKPQTGYDSVSPGCTGCEAD